MPLNDSQLPTPEDRAGSAPLRVVLMGTGPFAVPAFEAIRTAGHLIALVVTRPIPPVKSRKGPPPAPVRRWADERELPLADPPRINDPEGVAMLRAAAADLLVVCDYGAILRPETLATAPLGGINLHGSLLPAYRGAAPVQRALLSGDRETGVSVIHMTPKLDGGPLLATQASEIGETETAGELEQRLARLGAPLVMTAIEQLARWDRASAIGERQDPSRVSRAPRLHKSEGQIDWTQSTRQIDCHIRGMQPWPGAYTFVRPDENKPAIRLAIKQARPVDRPRLAEVPCGQRLGEQGLIVATGDGALEIETVQPAGRREMSGDEFVRGHTRRSKPLRLW